MFSVEENSFLTLLIMRIHGHGEFSVSQTYYLKVTINFICGYQHLILFPADLQNLVLAKTLALVTYAEYLRLSKCV